MIEADELPQGWTLTELGQIVESSKAKAEPGERDDAPYLSLEHIESGTSRILGYGRGSEVKSIKSVFQAGDVLYGKLRPYLNKVCRPNFDGICSTDILVLKPTEAVDPGFFHQLLTTPAVVAHAVANSNGINLPRTSFEALSTFRMCLPPLAEQRRIVARIEALQGRSRKAREALEGVPPLLEQFRQAVLAAAFRGDLTADWRDRHSGVEPAESLIARVKPIGRSTQSARATTSTIVGDYALSVGNCRQPAPDSWSWVPLTTVAKLETGHTPSRKHPEYWDGDIPWVCIKDASVNHGRVITGTLQNVTQLGLDNSAARLLPAGTVCLTRTANSIGYALVLGRPMSTSQDLVGWVCSEAVMPKYLMYLFIAERKALYRFAKGSTHPTVYFPEILSFWCCLPSLEEQAEIVNRLEKALARIEGQAELIWALLAELEVLDRSILAKAFRGKLVPQDPADEPASVLLERIRAEQTANGTGVRTARPKR